MRFLDLRLPPLSLPDSGRARVRRCFAARPRGGAITAGRRAAHGSSGGGASELRCAECEPV